MQEISFYVEGIQGKSRPRFTKSGRAYTPKATHDYEKAIANAYKSVSDKISDKPISMDILIRYEIPKSYPTKRVKLILLGKELPTKKPDIDNIAKVVLDGLNGVAYYDDTQVVELNIVKIYWSGKSNIKVNLKEKELQE